MKILVLVALAIALLTARAEAQDARLAERLSRETAATVNALVAEAERDGLPSEPLILKALEGASKGASDDRIVGAVLSLMERLRGARRALGPIISNQAELVAGADALFVGASPETLSGLRAARASSSVTMPLILLADLVQQGVAMDTVSVIVLQLAEAGVLDARLAEFRRQVQRDIAAGAAPNAAVSIRAEGILLAAPQGRGQ